MKEWPIEIKRNIENLLLEVGVFGKNGDWNSVEKLYLKAWALVPSPKYSWSDSQWLLLEIFSVYQRKGEIWKFMNFINDLEMAYPEGENDGTVAMISGIVYFESGQLSFAYERFDYLYKKFKSRPFQGEDKKYLEFYLKESASRKKHTG